MQSHGTGRRGLGPMADFPLLQLHVPAASGPQQTGWWLSPGWEAGDKEDLFRNRPSDLFLQVCSRWLSSSGHGKVSFFYGLFLFSFCLISTFSFSGRCFARQSITSTNFKLPIYYQLSKLCSQIQTAPANKQVRSSFQNTGYSYQAC